MAEPGWVNGDDIARGFVDECPECLELTLSHGECSECGYVEGDSHDDDLYDAYKEELAFLTEEDEK